jgi:hypothetical protein
MGCPNLNNLADYARGLLSGDESSAITSHLASGCQLCQEQQTWLSDVASLTAQDNSFEYPEWVIKRVVSQFEAQSVSPVAKVRQFFAQLIFDSLNPNQLAEIRSGTAGMGQAAGRQTLYQADGYDIDLRFEQSEDVSLEELIGQILPKQSSGIELAGINVSLLKNDRTISRARTNSQGIFKFMGVASGIYDLKISAPEGEINIQQLTTAGNS